MKRTLSLFTILAVIFASGCRTIRAPLGASGQKIKIAVLLDRGAAGLDARRAKYRQQLGAYMERDLLSRLNRCGYAATVVQAASDYKPQADAYLLAVKIKTYNPGNKFARMFVGYGAGATAIDIHYELRGQDKKPLLALDDGVGSSRDWTFCAAKLNQNMIKTITEHLAK